jgi:hypothetical protein
LLEEPEELEELEDDVVDVLVAAGAEDVAVFGTTAPTPLPFAGVTIAPPVQTPVYQVNIFCLSAAAGHSASHTPLGVPALNGTK